MPEVATFEENKKVDQVKEYKLNCIYFYLTEGCNLACRHCWITPKFESGEPKYPYVSLELFKSIVEQAKPLGLASVKLTGGEPLLHPQIGELLDYIKEQDLRLVVETNGLLATPELCKKMKDCKNTFVSVSIDGIDAETHEWVRGVKGSLEAAKQGVRNLVVAGFKPQIIMSIMRRNRDQIEAVVRMAEALGAGSVKFNLVQPTARGEQMHTAGETLTIEELVETGKWVEQELSKKAKIKLIYSHPAAFKPLSKLFSSNGDSCGTCGIFGIIGVLGNGKYAMCGIGETIPELIYGDAAVDRLADVWENNSVLKEIREGLPKNLEGLCSDCIMKNRCLGNCVAQNYYSTKNLFSTYWYCQQARERGLFPETRIFARNL